MTRLGDIMTTDAFSVEQDAAVAEVVGAMVRRRLGSALVMQGSMLLGIFTERDVLRAAASGRDLTVSPVSEWMTKHPVTSDADTDSEEAADLMLRDGFRHLPVVDGASVVGVVSLRDLLSARIRRRPA
jgi:CBS domain-containing protein